MPAELIKRKAGSVSHYHKKKMESRRSNIDNDSSYIGRKSSIDNISSVKSDTYTPAGSKLNGASQQLMDGNYGLKRPMIVQNDRGESPPSMTSKSHSAVEPQIPVKQLCRNLLEKLKLIINKDFYDLQMDFDFNFLERGINNDYCRNETEL